MSDYKMVPVVATEEMLEAVLDVMPVADSWGWRNGHSDAEQAYARILAAAPPFVVTDEMVKKALEAYWDYSWDMKKGPGQNDLDAMRAAIEAVLGGGV